jgi:ribosomal protein L29
MATAKKVVDKTTADKPKKALSEADMLKKIAVIREEAATLKRNMHMGDVQNVRAYSFKRKELARMLTDMNKMKAEEKK